MKSRLAAFLIILITILVAFPIQAQAADKPWEKFGMNIGGFLSQMDSSIRLGSGIGLDVDVEEALDLDRSSTVFRIDALWRFSDNRRHRLDGTWFSIKREGSQQIFDDITIENESGDTVTIADGARVESHFDLDIYEVTYSYSFFQDERVDVAAGIGMYIMPIDVGLRALGIVDQQRSETFTAPLPVVLLRMDVALTPKWFIRSGSQIFYVNYDTFTGSLLEFRAVVEYNPWRHAGIGLGFDTLAFSLESEGEDYPGIDLNGKVELKYTGLQIYLHLLF